MAILETSGEGLIGLLGGLALMALYIGMFIFWILMLMNAAKTRQWTWFVFMILFGFLALIYRFAAYESPEVLVERQRRRRERRKATLKQRDDRIAILEDEVDRLKGEETPPEAT